MGFLHGGVGEWLPRSCTGPWELPGAGTVCCFPAYVCDERRWLIARPITSLRSASSVMPSKPKPK
jgi:hypothetical protein